MVLHPLSSCPASKSSSLGYNPSTWIFLWEATFILLPWTRREHNADSSLFWWRVVRVFICVCIFVHIYLSIDEFSGSLSWGMTTLLNPSTQSHHMKTPHDSVFIREEWDYQFLPHIETPEGSGLWGLLCGDFILFSSILILWELLPHPHHIFITFIHFNQTARLCCTNQINILIFLKKYDQRVTACKYLFLS